MTMSKQDRRGAPSIYAESMTKGTHIKFPDYMFEWLENRLAILYGAQDGAQDGTP